MLGKFLCTVFVLVLLSPLTAHASGDYGCGAPAGNLTHRNYDSCNSVPFLSPANDTRLNLELLLIDSGKLAGSTNTSTQQYPGSEDQVLLRVPFNMEDWQVREPGADAKSNSEADSAGGSNDYAEGEGSRCRNAGDGLADFEEALKTAKKLPADEAAILDTARKSMPAICNPTQIVSWKEPAGIHSALGKQFASYIAGASAFYMGGFAEALNDFSGLAKSPDPWLRETSFYMVGRTQLNSAQQGAFGEWGDLQLEKVNKDAVKAAETAFNVYLQKYPHGQYSASARGLLRRVYWLGGDQTQLAAAYEQAFESSTPDAFNVTTSDLVQEFDTKLLTSVKAEQIKSPLLLAIVDLMRMRPQGEQSGTESKGALSLAELQAQKGFFATRPALYNYLLAAFYLYVDIKPEQALALLSDKPNGRLNYFAFSQQTLRVFALEANHRFDEAKQLVLQLIPIANMPLQHEQLELELAMIEEDTDHVDLVFAPGSPVTDKAIRTILVEHAASADLLRQRIKDSSESAGVRDAALYTLLYKELTGKKYQSFLSDLAFLPNHPSQFLAPFAGVSERETSGYQCPTLREVASTLQKQPEDAKSLNCLGELVRLHGVHYDQEITPPRTDLGGVASPFPGTTFSRMDFYLKVIDNSHAESDARAYALDRAIRCFAPSGYNECGTQDIPQSVRKQWFHTLKTTYPDSPWAKSLKYYW